MTTTKRTVVVVGNPQPASRTLRVARELGARVGQATGFDELEVIDLAADVQALVSTGDATVDAWRSAVLNAGALVVASPTYKASYTGLLKLFLDTFDKDQLAGTPTVAMMTGGSADHYLAVQHQLVPVLVEIGASCPTRGVYVAGAAIDAPDAVLDAWMQIALPVLRRASRRGLISGRPGGDDDTAVAPTAAQPE